MPMSHYIFFTKKKIRTALPSDEDQAMATGNMYRKFHEIWTIVFEACD